MIVPHILLVDDDSVCLTALAQRLRFAFRQHGLEVDVADSAVAALILVHTHHYNALIVDPMMPGVTGFKFIEQLAYVQPGVPVIVMSGFDVDRCEEEVARLGLTAFLPKPIDFTQLRRGLTAVLPYTSRHVRTHLAQQRTRLARKRVCSRRNRER